jgi:chromosome partitioning protein
VIVTVANFKGGVGKTTTSVFVAHALARATGAGCLVIDADPQGSAAQWARVALNAGTPLQVQVRARPSMRLAALAAQAPNVVIDTPPADGNAVMAAVSIADLVLVPTTPSPLDLATVPSSVQLASRAGKPTCVLLTRTRRTRSVAESEAVLREAGVSLLRTHIPLREALATAYGRPVRELHGYELATAELLGALPEQPFSVAAIRRRADAAGTRPDQQWSIGLGDQDVLARLKTSLARLAT